MEYKKVINIFFVVFIVLFYFSNSAMALEVQYPTLSTGASITSNTPLPEYFKYVFDFGIFVGFFAVFLTLVFAGVLYLLSPAVPNALSIAKDRVSGAITGLLILTTLYLIITTINPALKIFKLDQLDPIPPPPTPPQQAGVYIYNQSNCAPPVPETPHTTNVADLGPLTNRVNAVDIVQHPNENLYYISVLYNSPNFWGKCQYINPNSSCIPIKFPVASASVYQYDPSPNGEGVTLYRKSFYNRDGGWYKVLNSDIHNEDSSDFYVADLTELKFTDSSAISKDNPEGCTVPKEERDCTLWDKKGVCVKWECPSLAEENISSMEIKGNYVVLFVYFDQLLDSEEGPWSFCQAFPTEDDINKDGPKQIKWESVRNISTGRLPNFMIIFSVKQK